MLRLQAPLPDGEEVELEAASRALPTMRTVGATRNEGDATCERLERWRLGTG